MEPQEVQSLGMLAVAAAGLIVNLMAMRVSAGGRNDSLNFKSAYLEAAHMFGPGAAGTDPQYPERLRETAATTALVRKPNTDGLGKPHAGRLERSERVTG